MSYIEYENLENNLLEIDQDKLNIVDKTRSSIFSWNGQFSPQFIEALLKKYAMPSDSVLDPFMGSGTTLIECARKNIEVCGSELNPSAYFMSKSFEICNLSLDKKEEILDKIELRLTMVVKEDEILTVLQSLQAENLDDYVKDTVSLLIILLDLYNNTLTIDLLHKKWGILRSKILSYPYSEKIVKASLSDCRKLMFCDDKFSLLITSPPYINVFNYHQKYRRSVEQLGFDVLKIAKSEVGSNRKHRSNRLYTVIQYCIDMTLALQEWSRVCVPGSRFIVVVGRESNILSMSFSNSKIVYQLACEVLALDVVIKQERVFKNRFGKMIYEDILHFRNNKKNQSISEVELVEKARKVAMATLNEKLLSVEDGDATKIQHLEDAINNVGNISKSEGLYLG